MGCGCNKKNKNIEAASRAKRSVARRSRGKTLPLVTIKKRLKKIKARLK
jgi:hypothetical protein